MKQIVKNEKIKESYDELPYDSYSFPMSHPEHLCIIATLMGYEYPDFTRAKVLELGCAGGGNLLPIAIDNPEAEFIGIDLSPVQIAEANQHKKALDLSNIEFKTFDIMDIEKDFGEFDFIIAHGVFSWVPDLVRDKILKIINQNLSEKGLAYISWNVMPGWSAQKTIRDILLSHTKIYDKAEEKVEHAKLLMDFLSENMLDESCLKSSIIRINDKFKEEGNDSYILHEYLEHSNNQFYFSEFNKMLEDNKLKYVGDSAISSMNPERFNQETTNFLKSLDPLTKEQYTDYITGNPFRGSIVTKASNKQKKVDIEQLKKMYYYTKLKCDLDYDKVSIKDEISFSEVGSSFCIKSSDSITNSLLLEMSKTRFYAYSFGQMLAIIEKKLTGYDKNILSKSLLSALVRYILNGALKPTLKKSRHSVEIPDKPEAYILARYQASLPNIYKVTTFLHTTAQINDNEKILLQFLNGKNDIKKISELFYEYIDNNKISLKNNGLMVTSPSEKIKLVENLVKDSLKCLNNKIVIKNIYC